MIPEENDVVQLALKRLPPKEAYDRVWRLRRALQVFTAEQASPEDPANIPQCSVSHQLLPREQWTKAEEVGYTATRQLVFLTNNTQDDQYLSPIIREIESEMKEREDLEAMVLSKRSANSKEAKH